MESWSGWDGRAESGVEVEIVRFAFIRSLGHCSLVVPFVFMSSRWMGLSALNGCRC
jgi:hypothetical protein